jgi:hypothetical protein
VLGICVCIYVYCLFLNLLQKKKNLDDPYLNQNTCKKMMTYMMRDIPLSLARANTVSLPFPF